MFLGTCAEKAADTSPPASPASYLAGGGFMLKPLRTDQSLKQWFPDSGTQPWPAARASLRNSLDVPNSQVPPHSAESKTPISFYTSVCFTQVFKTSHLRTETLDHSMHGR